MEGNSKQGDYDEEGMTHVSLTRAPYWVPLYWSKSMGVYDIPSKVEDTQRPW